MKTRQSWKLKEVWSLKMRAVARDGKRMSETKLIERKVRGLSLKTV